MPLASKTHGQNNCLTHPHPRSTIIPVCAHTHACMCRRACTRMHSHVRSHARTPARAHSHTHLHSLSRTQVCKYTQVCSCIPTQAYKRTHISLYSNSRCRCLLHTYKIHAKHTLQHTRTSLYSNSRCRCLPASLVALKVGAPWKRPDTPRAFSTVALNTSGMPPAQAAAGSSSVRLERPARRAPAAARPLHSQQQGAEACASGVQLGCVDCQRQQRGEGMAQVCTGCPQASVQKALERSATGAVCSHITLAMPPGASLTLVHVHAATLTLQWTCMQRPQARSGSRQHGCRCHTH